MLGPKDSNGKRRGGLREFYSGFDADAGYDMRYPQSISAQRLKSIKKYGQYLHTLQSQPYIKVTPINKAQREALQDKTNQRLSRQKSYIYHFDSKEPPKVSIRHGVITEQVKAGPNLLVTARFYYFRAYNNGRQPLSMREMRRIVIKKMLPAMPDGFYSMVTDQHGRIDAPVQKKFIPEVLERYERVYGTKEGFSEAILGFQSYRTGTEADDEYVRRIQHRAAAQAAKSWRARQKRQTENFLRQARGLTRKKPGKKRVKAKRKK